MPTEYVVAVFYAKSLAIFGPYTKREAKEFADDMLRNVPSQYRSSTKILVKKLEPY